MKRLTRMSPLLLVLVSSWFLWCSPRKYLEYVRYISPDMTLQELVNSSYRLPGLIVSYFKELVFWPKSPQGRTPRIGNIVLRRPYVSWDIDAQRSKRAIAMVSGIFDHQFNLVWALYDGIT
ncbi:hypothetical protein EDD85DRAFT_367965 [Armillaria nabsnona]|nr:hypothetical protein EDD85DRAFT_367965 [Armillaria nabsnona]